MTIEKLKTIWKEFEDVPINSDDEMEIDFYCWEKGTYRLDIWHWIDEKLLNGLALDFDIL